MNYKKRFFCCTIVLLLLSNFSYAFSRNFSPNNKPSTTITITGNSDILHIGDSIALVIEKYGIDVSEPKFVTIIWQQCDSNNFNFKIDSVTHPVIIHIGYHRSGRPLGGLPGGYFIKPGDSIHIIDHGKFEQIFSGNGYQKLQYFTHFLKGANDLHNIYPHLTLTQQKCQALDSFTKKELGYIQGKEKTLNKTDCHWLKLVILTDCEAQKYVSLNYTNKIGSFKFENQKNQSAIKSIISSENLQPEYYGESYPFYLQIKILYDSGTAIHKQTELKSLYQSVKNNSKGAVRDQVICYILARSNSTDLSDLITDALSYIKNVDFIKLLANIRSKIGVGQTAYNFSLADTNNIMRSLSEFKGKTVVLDFWYTGCGNCRLLMPIMKEVEIFFEGKNVQFITVSIDIERKMWIQSIKSGKYTSPGMLNLFTNGFGEKNPSIINYNVQAYPTLIIIDSSGKIAATPLDPRIDGGISIKNIISGLL